LNPKLTGAGNGIGKQIALQLATVGATLICWDVEAAANERTVAEVRKKGGNKVKVHSYIVDISDREAIGKAAANVSPTLHYIKSIVIS
jgi:NAD(P)-dependent dehydrogenase (short-subunit alcohol dehydrogenase family)